MESGRPLFRHRRARSRARSAEDGCRMHRVRDGLQGQAGRKRRKGRRRAVARRSGQALRGDRRPRRPPRLLCRPDPRRRQRRSRDLEILRRRLGAADGRIGASAVLRARTQPRRRRRDRARDADARARPLSPVDRGSAQGQAVSARGSRRAVVSRKIPERLCRLEPAVRPDHLRPALQGRRQGAGDRADAEFPAGPRAGKAQGRGAGAGENLQGQRADLCAHHQHARQGQGDFRSLARLCRMSRIPAI